MGSRPTIRGALLLACTLLAGAGCGESLRGGDYRLSQRGQALDSCELLAPDGPIGDARLVTTGEEVQLDLQMVGSDRTLRMIGAYKVPVDGEPDGFSVHGTVVGVRVAYQGLVCAVHFGQVHLDATIPARRDDAFYGTLTLEEDLSSDQDPRCPRRCTLTVEHDAVLRSATP